MNTTTRFTAQDMPSAYRDAVAIARASLNGDGQGVAAVWNGTPNRAALVYALARLPCVIAEGVAAGTGQAVDLDAAFGDLLKRLPHDLTTLEGDQS